MTSDPQGSEKGGETATQGPKVATETFAGHLMDGARDATSARGWSRFINVAAAKPHLTVENQLALLSQSKTLDHPLGLVASLDAWRVITDSFEAPEVGEGLLVQRSGGEGQQFSRVYDSAQLATDGSALDIPNEELFVLHSDSAENELSRRWPLEPTLFDEQDSRVEKSIRQLLDNEISDFDAEIQDIIVSGATYIVQRTLGSQERAFESPHTPLRSFLPYTDDFEESRSWAALVTNSSQELLRSLGGKFDTDQTFMADSDAVVRLAAARAKLEETTDPLESIANDLVEQEGLPVFGDSLASLLIENPESIDEHGLVYEDFDSLDLYTDSSDSPSLE